VEEVEVEEIQQVTMEVLEVGRSRNSFRKCFRRNRKYSSSISPPQGNPGGAGFEPVPAAPSNYQGGGGGGAGAAGNSRSDPTPAGPGGAGSPNSISGSAVNYSGGGGGGAYLPTPDQEQVESVVVELHRSWSSYWITSKWNC
jgi:hypothetical protein